METMEVTDDIDTQGYWTMDDYEALLGLAACRDVAASIGNGAEADWAASEYDSLLAATDAVPGQTIAQNHLDYLPCSLLQPYTANRCENPRDANWTSPSGMWAWEGSLLGTTVRGSGLTMNDATYAYGFGRLYGLLPPDTTGGFPDDFYSSAYNAAQGTAGLASAAHRDQGILDYEFMLANSQGGPLSWWESSGAPDPRSSWAGRHPSAGQGSSLHAWGMAGVNKLLLDSLLAQRSDGALVVRRGVPRADCSPAVRSPSPTSRRQRGGGRPRHRDLRQRGDAPAERRPSHRAGPLPAAQLRPQHRVDLRRHRRPGDGHRHGVPHGPARDGHVAPRVSGLAPQRFRNPRRCRMRPAPQPPGQPSTNLVHLAHAHARDRSVA